ncbi:Chymase [Entomophthora muscae]|uniref:Chymase n=1 Tax=Entomophthora muscae TaxID=34485 RepID=A0ACC2SZS5_9FUNG|nr:Chymase [Entomophthora muscae]
MKQWGIVLLAGQAYGDYGRILDNLDFLGMLYYREHATCAGTLYTPNVFLTAAICLARKQRDYSVLTSATLAASPNCTLAKNRFAHDKDSRGVLSRRIKITKTFQHPQFNHYGTSAFNAGVAVLAQYPHPYPQYWRLVELDEFNISTLSLTNLTLVGWANTWFNQFGAYGLPPTSIYLAKKHPMECSHPRPEFPDAEFCPFPPANHPELCDYYFGSPLVLKSTRPVTIVGLKSWSGQCTQLLRSQPFVRTNAIFDWVESLVENSTLY